MDNSFLKITNQCFQNFLEINSALSLIETKGDSTIMIYKVRTLFSSLLEQIQKDNQDDNQTQEEQPIVVNQKNDKK
jgi:hypothetical protein